jgi:hypothetical protein
VAVNGSIAGITANQHDAAKWVLNATPPCLSGNHTKQAWARVGNVRL